MLQNSVLFLSTSMSVVAKQKVILVNTSGSLITVSKRKCTHEKAAEDKRQNTEVGETRKQIPVYVGYKQTQSSDKNTLKDIEALKLILKQKDKHIQALLDEIREKDNMIQQLCNKIEKINKFQEVKKENTLDELTIKLDTVIVEISGMCSAINELLFEARRKNILSDTKNITLNIRQKGILQISTED